MTLHNLRTFFNFAADTITGTDGSITIYAFRGSNDIYVRRAIYLAIGGRTRAKTLTRLRDREKEGTAGWRGERTAALGYYVFRRPRRAGTVSGKGKNGPKKKTPFDRIVARTFILSPENAYIK